MRTTWIPSTYYLMFNCPTLNPIIAVIFPLHVCMNYYYSSMIPKLFKVRVGELKKINNGGQALLWFTPIDQSHIEKLGIRGYEAYRT